LSLGYSGRTDNGYLKLYDGIWGHYPQLGPGTLADLARGKSSESVQCAMLKACDACADMGQL